MNLPTEAAALTASSATPKAPGEAYRWRMVAALWLIVALVVAVPSIGSGVVNAHMIKDLGIDRGIYGLGFGLFVMMMGLPGPLVAWGIRRHGTRRMMVLGCTLLLIGALAMATVVSNGAQFVVAFGLLTGGGVVAAGMLPAQTAVARWFTVKRALAVSVVLSAIEVGGFMAPPLLDRAILAAGGDWRAAWWLISGLALLALLAVQLVIRSKEADEAACGAMQAADALELPRRASRVPKTLEAWTPREALHTRSFWLLAAYVCVAGMCWIFLMAHGAIHLQDLGYSSTAAAGAVAMLVAASFIGNMGAGFLGDRVSPHHIAGVTMLMVAAGMVLAVRPSGDLGLLLFALPVGIGYGASQVCLMATLGNYYGPAAFPVLFGTVLVPGTLSAALIAGAAGAAFEQTHSYTTVLHICSALALLGAIAILLAGPPRRRA